MTPDAATYSYSALHTAGLHHVPILELGRESQREFCLSIFIFEPLQIAPRTSDARHGSSAGYTFPECNRPFP